MKKIFQRHARSSVYLIATDWLLLVASFIVAMHLRRYDPSLSLVRHQVAAEILVAMVYSTLLIPIFSVFNLYKRRTVLNRTDHLLRVIQAALVTVAGYFLLRTLTKNLAFVPSRLVIINWGVILLAALATHRLLVFPFLVRLFSHTRLQRKVIIIGVSQQSIRLAEHLHDQARYSTLRPIGFISDTMRRDEMITRGLNVLGPVADLAELVEPHEIEGAIITRNDMKLADLMALIEECIRLFGWVDVHADQSSVWHRHLDTDTFFDIPFVRMRAIPSGPALRLYKHVTDKLGALIGILITSPILIGTAIAIKLTSPGPLFYTRDRIGKDGKPFPFYKFRSMTVGADQDRSRMEEIKKHIQNATDGPQHKIINTAYITPVGRFIRKWAIDELPQLFNVLKGDMSLIGPRPVPAGEHSLEDDWHKRRFDIRPGCTGLWKVYAVKEGTSFNETVLYDLYYARNMSPLIDLYILFMTVWIIVIGRADG